LLLRSCEYTVDVTPSSTDKRHPDRPLTRTHLLVFVSNFHNNDNNNRNDVLAHLRWIFAKLTRRGGSPVIRPVFSGFRRKTETRGSPSRVRIRLSNAEELDVANASLGKTPPFRRGADISRTLSGRRYPRPVKLRRGRPARRCAPCNFTTRGPLSVGPVYFP